MYLLININYKELLSNNHFTELERRIIIIYIYSRFNPYGEMCNIFAIILS